MKTKASLVRSKVGAQRDRIEADFQLADWSGTARLATRLEASVLTVTVKIESNVPTMSAGIDFPNIFYTNISMAFKIGHSKSWKYGDVQKRKVFDLKKRRSISRSFIGRFHLLTLIAIESFLF